MMTLVALTRNLVSNHAGSHLLNNSSGGVASGVLLRALGIPRMGMQRRALTATAKEPLGGAHGDSYHVAKPGFSSRGWPVSGGHVPPLSQLRHCSILTPQQRKHGVTLLFWKQPSNTDWSKIGVIVAFREGHKMEMKQLSKGLKSMMMSLIKTKDEDEAAQVPATKMTKRIVFVPNRDFDNEELNRELSRRLNEYYKRRDIKEQLEKFFPGRDPSLIRVLPLPPRIPKEAKAFLEQMKVATHDIGLSLKLIILYDTVTGRLLLPPPQDEADVP